MAAMLVLSGCASTWSRPATPEAEFALDSRACQHMNTELVFLTSGAVGAYVTPSGYRRCMLEEGYTEGGPCRGDSGWLEEQPPESAAFSSSPPSGAPTSMGSCD